MRDRPLPMALPQALCPRPFRVKTWKLGGNLSSSSFLIFTLKARARPLVVEGRELARRVRVVVFEQPARAEIMMDSELSRAAERIASCSGVGLNSVEGGVIWR